MSEFGVDVVVATGAALMDDRMSPFVSSFTSTVLLMRTHLKVTDDGSCDILDSACICSVSRIVQSICVTVQNETCTETLENLLNAYSRPLDDMN